MRNSFLFFFVLILVTSCGDIDKSYINQKFLGINFKTSFESNSITGTNDIRLKFDSIEARLITSNRYSPSGEPDYLLIHCHGNSQSYMNTPSQKTLDWFKDNGISFATIQIQDKYEEPFNTLATGWGNEISYKRVIDFYEYLQTNYNFHKSIIISGASMGGLTMGQLANNKDIPILFCIGISPVPSLEEIFNRAEKRRPIIRNSYGLKTDGSEDEKLDSIFLKYDWYELGNKISNDSIIKAGFPNTYIYYGVDDVFEKDFGGLEVYHKLQQSIVNAGSICTIKTNGKKGHVNRTLFEIPINDSIFHKEGIIQ